MLLLFTFFFPSLCNSWTFTLLRRLLISAQPQAKGFEPDRSHATGQIMPPKGKGKKGKKDDNEEYWYATSAEKSNDDMR